MKKTFTINGKEYQSKPFTYNTVCDLQDLGFDVEHMGSREASMDRAFLALWSGMSTEQAGEEIGKHIIAGGSLVNLELAIKDSMDSSDFFQTLAKNATQDEEQQTAESN